MKNTSRFLVLTAAIAVASSAHALTLIGTTTGYFTDNTNTNVATLSGLSFTNGSFSADVSTLDGYFAIGGGAITDSFGQVSLANSNPSHSFAGEKLNVVITFTNPADVNPNTPTYTALLTGSVQNTTGGVTITFGPAKFFTFDGGAQSFDLTLDKLSIQHGNQGYVTGSGTVVTPAPAAMASFAVGAFGALRRRRRNA